MSLRFVASTCVAATTVLIAGFASTGSASASGRPLAPLNQWGAATARSFDAGQTSPRAVERRIAALRRTVRTASPKLLRADATTRSIEFSESRAALDRSLARVQKRLPATTARFFFLAYQAQLERLAERAGLDRTPTNRPLTPAGADGDSDADGVIDQVDRDSDGDGMASARDGSDLGWGIPDALAVRRPTLGGFCVFATERVPDPRTVREATAWTERAAQRGCRAPRVSARSIPTAATTPAAPGLAKAAKRRLMTLRQYGFSARGARLDGAVLTLTTSTKQPVKAYFEVLVNRRSVMKSNWRRVAAGRQQTQVTFASAVLLPTTAILRVTVARRGRKGRGTVRLAIVEPPPKPDPEPIPSLPPTSPFPVSGPGSCEVDTDRDSVPDCQETVGFDFAEFVPSLNCREVAESSQCGSEKTRRVTSDPKKPNTDGDAIVVADGTKFELTDAEEWFLFRSGGKSDPSTGDSDADGVGDVEERERWGTEPGNPDTDGDGVEFANKVPIGLRAELYDGAEVAGGTVPEADTGPTPRARYPTSPTFADTDGDGSSDTAEVLGGRTNPLVAVVPEYRVTPAPGTTFSVQIGTTVGTSYGLTNTKTDEQSKEESNSTVDTQTQEHGAQVSAEVSGGSEGIGVKVSASYSYNSSKSHESSLTASKANRTEAQQSYEDVLSETTAETGSISVFFRLTNPRGDRDVTVKNLAVDASFLCGRSQAGKSCGTELKRAFLARLTPVGGDDFTLAANESLLVPFKAEGVPSQLLKALAANPSNLSFSATGGDLFQSSTGPNLLDSVGRSIPQNTGRLSIDDSQGRVKDYSVAVHVNREWGKPDASRAPDTSLLDVLRFAKVTATTRNIKPAAMASSEEVLEKIKTSDNQGTEIDSSSDPVVTKGTWAILADTQTPEGQEGFANRVKLGAGDTVILGYVKDADNDGLLDRQERLLGTDDVNGDSDGDGTTGPCGSSCPRPTADGRYASDYFEAAVGWVAGPTKPDALPGQQGPLPDTKSAYEVRSDPATCDGDDDGSFDGPGTCDDKLPHVKQHQGKGELANKTDPVDPDTDGDTTEDGRDAAPLNGSPPAPLRTASFEPKDLTGCAVKTADGRCAVSGKGTTLESREFALCGPKADHPNCANATGLYRISWDVDTASAEGEPQEVQGRYEVLEGKRVLLRADFDRGEQNERRSAGASDSEELFFATSRPSTKLKVRFVLANSWVTATAAGLVVAEVQPSTFLNQSTNLNFAGIAIPGSMLNGANSFRHPGAGADGELPLPSGYTTGPTLGGETGSNFGVSIPGRQFGWRARFALRDAGDEIRSSTATVGLMGTPKAGGTGLGTSEVTTPDTTTTDSPLEHFKATNPGNVRGRAPLVQGHVRTEDLQTVGAPEAAAVTEFFETGTNGIPNVSVAIRKTGPEELTVVNVTLEPIGNSVKEYVGFDKPAGGTEAADGPWLAAGFAPGNGFKGVGLWGPDEDVVNGTGEMAPDETDGSLKLETVRMADSLFRRFGNTGGFPRVNSLYHRWTVVSQRIYYGNCDRNNELRYEEVPVPTPRMQGRIDRDAYGSGDNLPLLSFVPALAGRTNTHVRVENFKGNQAKAGPCGFGMGVRVNDMILGTRPLAPFGPDD